MSRYTVQIIVNGFARTSIGVDHVKDAMQHVIDELDVQENDRVTFKPSMNAKGTLVNAITSSVKTS